MFMVITTIQNLQEIPIGQTNEELVIPNETSASTDYHEDQLVIETRETQIEERLKLIMTPEEIKSLLQLVIRIPNIEIAHKDRLLDMRY